jgi:signal transduction histidine kinase
MALTSFGRKAVPHTLATLIARRVFSAYLLLAVAATCAQVALEYRGTRKMVEHELRTMALAFEPGLRQALWNYQEGQVRVMAEGLLSSPLIRGVSVRDAAGLIWVETAESQAAPHRIAVTIPILFDVLGTAQHIGEFRLISDERAVWQRMQDGLVLIVLAALVKTLGLWMVIRWVVQHLLAQPLGEFTQQLQRSQVARDLVLVRPLSSPAQEWTVLGDAFNQLAQRLQHQEGQLTALTSTLEEQVQRRTQALNERTLELAQERDHVAAILNLLPEGVMVVDAQGTIVRINAAACQQLPFVNDPPGSVYDGIPAHQHGGLADGLKQVALHGRWTGEIHLRTPDAGARCLLLVALRVAPAPHAKAVMMVVDISAQKDAEAANKAKSRFLAALGHDLRQPANALGIYLTLLREKFGAMDSGRLIDKAVDCQAALAHMFDSLLFMARVESKRLVPDMAPVALQAVWSRLSHVYGPQAEKKQLQLVWASTDAVVNTDCFMLERLLSNLVSNAIRYTAVGTVVVGARERGRRVRLYVADTGVGIPNDARPHIFDEFFQMNKGRGEHLGVGLGLSIVASLADALGLRCRVFSRAKGGTLFVLSGLLTPDVRP